MALPTDFTTVTVTGRYVLLDGTPATGTVTFSPDVRLRSVAESTTVMPSSIVATLNTDGSFSVDLPATDDPDISPSGWHYIVVEKVGSFQRTFNIFAPLGGPIDLTLVAPVANPEDMVRLVASINGYTPDAKGNVALPIPEVFTYSVHGAVFLRTGTHRLYNDTGRSMDLTSLRVALGATPEGANVTVRLNVNDVEHDMISIVPGTFTTRKTLSGTFADGDYLTIDVTEVGTTTSGSDLTVSVVAA